MKRTSGIERRGKGAEMKASDTFSHAGVRYRFVRWGEAAAGGPDVGTPAGGAPDAGDGRGGVGGCAAAGGCGESVPDGSAAQNAAPACASRPFVLLHGFAQSARSWDDVAARLAPWRPVYALDFVGHGESERPCDPAAYDMDAACGALLAFLRYVQDENVGCAPCVVGYSMGGRMALAAAARALPSGLPFGALVLESAGLGPASPAEREEAARRNGGNARRLREEGVAAFMDAWERLPLFATQQSLPSGVRACVRRQRLDNDAEALARMFEGTGAHRMPDRAEVLATLQELQVRGVPVCYVAGERDAKYRAVAKQLAAQGAASAQIAPAAQGAFRPLTVRVVSQAGHNVHLERPAAFVRVLEEFSRA